eukprot:gnl/MRDRNA2_/MRDRNA2_35792_c0_seq1.p1 gnl/MRDRNA2_/MRDRNA2_35792_c0~~gnl/MRDRNA2_/MRDRNA2_35792_c0_seq1.p1  ORF type:complete len:429 (-),score=91.98 gnl/MRDRNA2_/MRDRNA2_35792_c0_seq1:185-1471(-)
MNLLKEVDHAFAETVHAFEDTGKVIGATAHGTSLGPGDLGESKEEEMRRKKNAAARKKKAVGLSSATKVSTKNLFQNALKDTYGLNRSQDVQADSGDILGEHLPTDVLGNDPSSPSSSAGLQGSGRPKISTKQRKELEQEILREMRQSDALTCEELYYAVEWAITKGLPENDPIVLTAQAVYSGLMDPVKHPTRAEILMAEPHEDEDDDEGGLKTQSSFGRTQDLLNSINGYILDRDLPCKSECWAQRIWKDIDFNNDGILSKDEAKELVRIYLSRPAVGLVLGKNIADSFTEEELSQSAGDTKCSKTLAVMSSRAVAIACRDTAKDMNSLTQKFWGAMDEDHNGEVVCSEFLHKLPDALKVLDGPILQRARPVAVLMLKAGAQKAKNPEECKETIRKWKKKEQKRLEEEAAEEERIRKENEAKCSVM